MNTRTKLVTRLTLAASLVALQACQERKPSSAAPSPITPPGQAGHADHGASRAGHGGPVIQLGEATVGPFTVGASRDEGQIVAGKDAPIDVTVTPAATGTSPVVAVRLWIGTEDAKGSVRAKADIENPAEPNRWHTHVEIPDPLPTELRLWVEIEDEKGERWVGSFDLKA